jgi:hypothetical protein
MQSRSFQHGPLTSPWLPHPDSSPLHTVSCLTAQGYAVQSSLASSYSPFPRASESAAIRGESLSGL